jgi:hypothetical protein
MPFFYEPCLSSSSSCKTARRSNQRVSCRLRNCFWTVTSPIRGGSCSTSCLRNRTCAANGEASQALGSTVGSLPPIDELAFCALAPTSLLLARVDAVIVSSGGACTCDAWNRTTFPLQANEVASACMVFHTASFAKVEWVLLGSRLAQGSWLVGPQTLFDLVRPICFGAPPEPERGESTRRPILRSSFDTAEQPSC